MNSAITIAYILIKRGISEGNPLTQMKLQKMLYFAQGYHLVMNKTPLIEADFQAWKYGPVVPAVYQACKIYGSSPIEDLYIFELFADDKYFSERACKSIGKEAIETINFTWEALKGVSAIALSNWTHYDNSPWSQAIKSGTNSVISESSMNKYFETFLKN
ncbi:MAG: DUF4065 domain-containing protein [Paludibacteraceae bacterium]|nr:DUF4065 domain-containing protein [Paludibacteraceae bacterium]